jgi:hypothetical protein
MTTTTRPVLTTRPLLTTSALLTSALLLTAALVGCRGDGADAAPQISSSPATTTTTPTAAPTMASTSGELTDAEILWVGRFQRTVRPILEAPGKMPSNNGTPAQMRAEAKSLRACRQALAGTKDPGPRLQSIYRTFTDACTHYDRAAECGLTLARYMNGVVVGSSEERKLNEAADCYGAELGQGAQKLADALTDSYKESLSMMTGPPTP